MTIGAAAVMLEPRGNDVLVGGCCVALLAAGHRWGDLL